MMVTSNLTFFVNMVNAIGLTPVLFMPTTTVTIRIN